MRPKPEMLVAIATTWMIAAVACAAMPFLYAVPRLQAAGQFAPLLVALLLGLAVGGLFGSAAYRLCDLGPSTKQAKTNAWGSLTFGSAAFLGIIGWGAPVGLIYAVSEFLKSSDPFVVIPVLIIWPLGGMAFGLMMRWFGQMRGSDSQEV
jgi:hypothetical protein